MKAPCSRIPRTGLAPFELCSRRHTSAHRPPSLRGIRRTSIRCTAEEEVEEPIYTQTEVDALLARAVCDVNQFEDVLEVPHLRDRLNTFPSPYTDDNNSGAGFVGDSDVVTLHTMRRTTSDGPSDFCVNGITALGEQVCVPLPKWARRSGPRGSIFFDPSKVSAAIVTCGGLCPGLNDVIQNIVTTLIDYGVPEDSIVGIRYGLRGFYEKDFRPIPLSAAMVEDIHLKGGTVLGTSRGGADMVRIVEKIKMWGLDHVYVIGGNGGNAAAHAIQQECQRQNVTTCIAAVPKSIDNDILMIDRCFGFETAAHEAQAALMAAKVEARSARRGVGLVKLMGRQSGHLALHASMASGVVDVCLIPEIRFDVDKVCEHVAATLEKRGHCVICVAEGAGQELFDATEATDASGNPILADIGRTLAKALKAHFRGLVQEHKRSGVQKEDPSIDLKYIDPTYMIRAISTTTNDRVYCKVLGQNAVHGAFCGYTGFTVGLVNTHYVLLPIPTVVQAVSTVNPKGRTWNRLKTAIGQPDLFTEEEEEEGGHSMEVGARDQEWAGAMSSE